MVGAGGGSCFYLMTTSGTVLFLPILSASPSPTSWSLTSLQEYFPSISTDSSSGERTDTSSVMQQPSFEPSGLPAKGGVLLETSF